MRFCVVLLCVCLPGVFQPVLVAGACLLPAATPILPGSDHAGENHFEEEFGLPGVANYNFQRFDGANLTGACFLRTDMAGSTLRDVTASGATFQSLTLAGADFTAADLSGAKFLNVNAYRAVFDAADLSGAIFGAGNDWWQNAGFVGASFDGANLTGAEIGPRLSFAGASLVGARLGGVYAYESADFNGADLRKADLSTNMGATEFRASLVHADLRGARLDGAFFAGPMFGANLVGASISGTTLSTDMRGAKLDGLDLTSAFFSNRRATDLRWASLRDTTIRLLVHTSRLEGADLRGADLRAVRDSSIVLNHVDRFTVYDLTTQFPAGFDPVSSAMTLYGDNNDDGVVDVDDLNNVRNHFGRTGAIGLPGDTVFDGVVDIDDLNAVRNAFGSRAAVAVPEPGAIGLWCAGLIALAVKFRPRHCAAGSKRRVTLRYPVCLLCLFSFAVLMFARSATACHLPAVFPILPGSDHSHERHSVDPPNNYAFENFSGANLSDACFTDISLVGTNLRGVNAAGAWFNQSKLVSADFTGADLRGAMLTDVNAFGAVFDGANLAGASLRNSRWPVGSFASASFNGANLSGVVYGSISFVGASFVGAKLLDIPERSTLDFTGADMRGVELSLAESNFRSFNGIFVRADLRGALLDGFEFGNSMAGVDLRGASIVGTTLHYDLRGAKLDGLSFEETSGPKKRGDFRWSSLRDADLGRMGSNRYEGADIRGANLRRVSPIPRALDHVDRFTVYDLTTQFPAGFDPVSSAMTLYGDNNDDGVVDIDDLNNVRNHFGRTGPIGLPGDTVFDGVVDIDDLNAVRNAFGTRAVAPVPEPATCVLWCGGLIWIAARLRRRCER